MYIYVYAIVYVKLDNFEILLDSIFRCEGERERRVYKRE